MSGLDFLKKWLGHEGMTSVEIRREEMQSLHDQFEKLSEEARVLREALNYAYTKERSPAFDYDTWRSLCEAALRGGRAQGALENEQAINAQLREMNQALKRELDATRKALLERSRELDEATGIFHKCGVIGWSKKEAFKEAAAWHDEIVAFLKRIGKW